MQSAHPAICSTAIMHTNGVPIFHPDTELKLQFPGFRSKIFVAIESYGQWAVHENVGALGWNVTRIPSSTTVQSGLQLAAARKLAVQLDDRVPEVASATPRKGRTADSRIIDKVLKDMKTCLETV